jgi:hypothetical protein
MVRGWTAAALFAGLIACDARLGDPSGSPTAPSAPPDPSAPFDPSEPPPGEPARSPFACDDTAPVEAPGQLHRLTRNQLARSLERLNDAFAPAPEAARARLAADLQAVPPEIPSKAADYRRMSQSVSQAHVDGWYRVATGLAEAWTADGAAALLDCVDGPACVEGFVRALTRRAFRRPPSDAEVRFFVDDVHGSSPDDADALRDVVAAVLSAPPFLYRIELGAEPIEAADDTYALGPYELASRLSYHFWQAPPDEALLAAAAGGELDTEAGYQAQVERMLDDPRARVALESFFAEWLELDHLPDLDANRDQPRFAAYAGDDLPGPELRDRMIRDVLDLVLHHALDDPEGTLADLFTSRLAFARTDDLAAIYGDVPTWSPGEAPRELPASERAGVLTRPALLADAQAGTRPIIRGTRIRQRILCDELSLPDDMQNIRPGSADDQRTTRERTEDLTERPGTVCASCHRLINPLGYALESYDGLGRFRTLERTYDETGRLVSTLPVDTTAAPELASRDEPPVGDAIELSRRLADHPKTQACFARQYVRFTFGRREDLERDACLLDRLWRIMHDGGTLRDVMKAVAFEPAFRRVRKGDG